MLGTHWEPVDFTWVVGDRVQHVKDEFRDGTVRIVEDNGLSVMVHWDDMAQNELDFQWANKLVRLDKKLSTICAMQSMLPGPLGVYSYCTRGRGHDGHHVAVTTNGEIVARWIDARVVRT